MFDLESNNGCLELTIRSRGRVMDVVMDVGVCEVLKLYCTRKLCIMRIVWVIGWLNLFDITMVVGG